MAGHLVEFTDANFKSEVLEADGPVLVDFWAPWCGPCRALTPIIEQLAGEYSGRVKVGKVNTDDNNQTASGFGISSIPTVMVFKNGEMIDKVVGVPPKAHFDAMLKKALS
jgi:thioredoxin 1